MKAALKSIENNKGVNFRLDHFLFLSYNVQIMRKEEFCKTLKQLHNELGSTHSVDENGRKLLSVLRDDIRRVLEQSEQEDFGHHPSFIEQLKEAALHFDQSHPRLASSLRQMIDTLSNIGI